MNWCNYCFASIVALECYNYLVVVEHSLNQSDHHLGISSYQVEVIDLSGNYVTTNTVFNLGPP